MFFFVFEISIINKCSILIYTLLDIYAIFHVHTLVEWSDKVDIYHGCFELFWVLAWYMQNIS